MFINEHKDYFTNTILEKWGLDVLISINAQEYIVSTPDLSLTMEKTRLSKGAYEDIDTLAMSIRDTLWDIVTVYSGNILLECAGCGWTEEPTGEEHIGLVGKGFHQMKKK